MRPYEEYNRHFSLDDHIGTVISEEEFQVLMAGGKIFTTYAWMDRGQAFRAIGGDILDYKEGARKYMGLIVANSLKDAETIAKRRGWGEEVDMVLDGIASEQEERNFIRITNSQRN